MSNARTTCTYNSLPDTTYWKRSVAEAGSSGGDPVIGSRVKITAADKAATAGSCFAQHIAALCRARRASEGME